MLSQTVCLWNFVQKRLYLLFEFAICWPIILYYINQYYGSGDGGVSKGGDGGGDFGRQRGRNEDGSPDGGEKDNWSIKSESRLDAHGKHKS